MLSPYSLGLKEAITGIDKYWVIYNTHVDANRLGLEVDYSGIDSLFIEIPKDAKPIPLGQACNFRGIKLLVLNSSKENFFLFECGNTIKDVVVDKNLIDTGDFSTIPELSKGQHLLIIEDKTPWVQNREGYSYGATRKDCMVIDKGKAQNRPICQYNNEQSSPKCFYATVFDKKREFINLSFIRDADSSCKTFLLRVSYQNNFYVSNIDVFTPFNSHMYGDRVFSIENCSNVVFRECNINGTYSLTNKYGYGISMDNVYNTSFIKMDATANWGIFGTNNVNTASLSRCNVNRFDIHCYGKDVECKDCRFSNGDNSFTSVYGEIKYLNCEFQNSTPVHIDYSYNAYTPFTLIMKDCIYTPSKKRNYIIMGASLLNDSIQGRRKELSKNNWPCVSIDHLTIKRGNSNVSDVYLFMLSRKWYKRLPLINGKIDIPSKVKIKGLKIEDGVIFKNSNIGDVTSPVLALFPIAVIFSFLAIKRFSNKYVAKT